MGHDQHRTPDIAERDVEGRTDAESGGTDQHYLVLEILHRHRALLHVVERVDVEGCAITFTFAVEEGVHVEAQIGFDLEITELHAIAEINLDVLGLQVVISGRNHQGLRRIKGAVVFDRERLEAYAAIDIGWVQQMPDATRCFTDHRYR